VIRRATLADHAWIRGVAADVYRELGDYRTIIGSWLDHPGVLTYLDEADTLGPRGFTLLGFYEPDGADEGLCFADLLAIAVARPHQRQGLGRALLAHALAVAEAAACERGIREVRLTVAETNPIGRRLFAAEGFAVLDEDHGLYDGGQRAIRMRRPLIAAAARQIA
jgi:ribosomal protein S18 acetylase RimI-like enzyme